MTHARPDTSIEKRIDELLDAMTREEKLGQLTQLFYFGGVDADSPEGAEQAEQPRMVEAELAAGRVGSLLFVTEPSEFNRLQRLAIEGNRQAIPVMFGFDVIHGYRTIFPVPIAMAASWCPGTAEAAQQVAAREARAAGVHWAFAPMIDIARDPRWGRIIEGAGEDPVLGSAMAAAQVRGFQGDDIGRRDRIIAGPKHFAGYGWAQGGRDYDESWISDAELHNVVLPPFRAAVEAGAGNIMTAYMPLNGVPATGNAWLLHDILRDEWGFEGFVVSDANAVRSLETHGFARDLHDAGVRALRAGVDMEMAMAGPAYATLGADDEVDEDAIDESVRRILRAKLRLGLFEHPFVDEQHAAEVLADPAHREVAREVAERSAVLLTNDGTLPLDAGILRRVAVLGPLADSRRDILGPWTFAFDLDETVTVLDGLRARLGDGVRVDHAPGLRPAQRRTPSIFDMWPGNVPADPEDFDDDAEMARAERLAADADVAVVVVGEWQNEVGENASRSSLELPGRQLELVRRAASTGTPVVVVVLNGRPLDLEEVEQHAAAVLDAWYPGTSGGHAIARLLTGDAVPAGRLPFTWPRGVGQVPMVHSHLTSFEPQNTTRRYWDADGSPLHPFGHGLSYASFEYGPARLSASRVSSGSLAARPGADGEVLRVSAEVTNTSTVDADEVVQLYLHQVWGTAARPVRELKAFRRVPVAAGATVTVEFDLTRAELQYWNAAVRDWVVDAADVEVAVGGSSTAAFSARFTVTD